MNPYALERSLKFIESWLPYQVGQSDLAGLSVAVAHRGELVFSSAFGWADIARRVPLQKDHVFNIGSQSKMLTATALGQLVEVGQVHWDDPVAHYLPWLNKHSDKRFRTLTIRQLMWHGGGILRDGGRADFWQLREPFPDEAALKRLVFDSELVTRQSRKPKYSNLGYALLGRVIEQASQQTYKDFLEEIVVEPLSLHHSFCGDLALNNMARASSYTTKSYGQRRAIADPPTVNTFDAATGWYMNPGDLAIFLDAHLPGRAALLDEPTKQLLHNGSRQHLHAESEQSQAIYGMGFETQYYDGRKVLGHSGGFIGHRSAAYFDPESSLVVCVMANTKDAPVFEACAGIFGVFNYFAEHANEPLASERSHYNERLHALWQTTEIVATNDRIVSVFPDDWMPFSYILEELATTDDPNMLVVAKCHELLAEGETLRYYFNKSGKFSHAIYAGQTVLPEKSFKTWLETLSLP